MHNLASIFKGVLASHQYSAGLLASGFDRNRGVTHFSGMFHMIISILQGNRPSTFKVYRYLLVSDVHPLAE